MNRSIFFTVLFLLLLINKGQAQCVTGQDPESAFPVCGLVPFTKDQVPACGGNRIFAPGCNDVPLSDLNPFYYKFTCFVGGTLGFTIVPNTSTDDYDWQLFDVTGHAASEIYSNNSLFVACNWSGETGTTGASSAGTSLIICASTTGGPFRPLFSSMPTLIQGHNYLLMISHFTVASQSGYSLTFDGGTASITDPKLPALLTARAPCDGTLTTIKLNKAMKCSSLSADGSEFTLVPNVANVIGAVGVNCNRGFDMDSINLTLDNPIPPGNYFIKIKNGSDGNTLLDNCDRAVPVGDSIPLTIYPLVPTPMDSLTKFGCAPDTLQLVFRKKIFCNSIEPGGTDFTITGPDIVNVIGAAGLNCSDGLSDKIIVKLAKPLQLGGVYTITLVTGTDGNTILDECSKETPAGQSINFNVADTVNADFTYNIIYGCERDTINYFHDGRNGVNKWTWNFDNTRQSKLQNPVISYASFGQKLTQLIVSNGVCKDTSAWVPIILDNTLKAAFESPEYVCPNEQATFKDISVGKQITWRWDFDNGNTSTLQQPPPQTYPFALQFDRTVKPQLIITDSYGCSDTAANTILVPNSCFIDVPNAFTPNGDGINDQLYPLAAYKAKDLLFRIYNRFGQLIFEGHDWSQRWDGKMKGQPAEAGTYVWTLHYINIETGAVIDRKGTSILIR